MILASARRGPIQHRRVHGEETCRLVEAVASWGAIPVGTGRGVKESVVAMRGRVDPRARGEKQ